jgi:hypothetical protein
MQNITIHMNKDIIKYDKFLIREKKYYLFSSYHVHTYKTHITFIRLDTNIQKLLKFLPVL